MELGEGKSNLSQIRAETKLGDSDKKSERTRKILKALRVAVAALAIGSFPVIGSEVSEAQDAGESLQSVIEQIPEKEKDQKKEIELQKLEALQKIFGDFASQIPRDEEVAVNIPKKKKLKVDSLMTAEGELSAGEIKHFLSFLPKGWVEKEVSLIENRQNKVQSAKNFIGFDAGEINAVAYWYVGQPEEIIFYRRSKEMPLAGAVIDIYHEVAHGNSPFSDNELTYDERLDMLMNIWKRVSSPDRYMSSYVESIRLSPDVEILSTPEGVATRKANEYWAVICQVYFISPKELLAEDFNLVHAFVRKTDPKYDPFKMSERMRKVIQRKLNEERYIREHDDNQSRSRFFPQRRGK